MAAPTTTARVTPTGRPLKDGFATKVASADNPDIAFWEKTVKPISANLGEPINQSNMHNIRYVTKAPRSLIDCGSISGKCCYRSAAIDQIWAALGVEGAWTVENSDGSTDDVWGWLNKWEPDECSEGKQPEASFEIVISNWDPTNNVEAGPNHKTATGTDTPES